MDKLGVIAEIVPKGEFPVASSENIQAGNKRLDAALAEAATEVAKKAYKTYVDTELAKKASTTSVNAELAKKANSSDVESQLAGKANSADVTEALSNKADSSALRNTNEALADVETEQAILSARMDTFTRLEEGSTTGDAELADGRVGVDGETYENIGGAIRGQVAGLKDDIDYITGLDDQDFEWSLGVLDNLEVGSAISWKEGTNRAHSSRVYMEHGTRIVGDRKFLINLIRVDDNDIVLEATEEWNVTERVIEKTGYYYIYIKYVDTPTASNIWIDGINVKAFVKDGEFAKIRRSISGVDNVFLYGKNGIKVINAVIRPGEVNRGTTANYSLIMPCETGKTYCIKRNIYTNHFVAATITKETDTNALNYVCNDSGDTIMIRTGAKSNYIVIWFYNTGDDNGYDMIECAESITITKLPAYETGKSRYAFYNPNDNGLTAVHVKNYCPIVTDRLGISEITGNAYIGIAYGNSELSDSLRVVVNNSECICSLYINGLAVQTESFEISSPAGKYLQVQNTGRALLVYIFERDMSGFSRVCRFDYGNTYDARKESLTVTWKTFIISETKDFSTSDMASFDHFDSAIRSGSNSVSIRFLTYENGRFIQNGNYMYYLVEGTGETIDDLFTQIVRINFKTFEVQTIGAIMLVRNDGIDEGILLGDDSIKVVYDRNDNKWKGISCGMEYHSTLVDQSTDKRPKLYFETNQNILDGGLIVVRNAQQITYTDGSPVGTSDTKYTEDFDFYYDGSRWIITGNKVNTGMVIYSSPDLKANYTELRDISYVPAQVRDTGNQFVNFAGTFYITTGGKTNSLGIRSHTGEYLGELNVDMPLPNTTNGPWCTLVPFREDDKVQVFLMSFDRVDLTGGTYDHGGLYCWQAYDTTSGDVLFDAPTASDGEFVTNFPAGSPLDYTFSRLFGRRDFYNGADSFGVYNLDINTNLMKLKGNPIYAIGNNFNFTKI